MSKTTVLLTFVGAAGAALLSGCEIILPIIAATSGGGGGSTYTYDDPYYYGDYEDYYRYERLDVQVEELTGRVYGIDLAPSMGGLSVEGNHSGLSAYFALTVADEVGEEPAPSPEDLSVVLDVCPIEEYATGNPIPNPLGSYVNLYVCNAYDCLHSFDGDLELRVVDGSDGRRVTVHGTWPGGSHVDLGLRYVATGEDGRVRY